MKTYTIKASNDSSSYDISIPQVMIDTLHYIKSYIKDYRNNYRMGRLYLFLLYKIYMSGKEQNPQVLRILSHYLNGMDGTEVIYPEIPEEMMAHLASKPDESVGLCIQEFIDKRLFQYLNKMIMPDSVIEQCIDCVKPKAGESVYLPFCGLATAALKLPDDVHVLGEEADDLVWALGQIQLWSEGRSGDCVLCRDSINTLTTPDAIPPQDVIIMKSPYDSNNFESAYSEDLPIAIEQAFKLLSNNGQMAVVAPAAFCSSRRFLKSREKLLPYISSVTLLDGKPTVDAAHPSMLFVIMAISKRTTDHIIFKNEIKSASIDKSQLSPDDLNIFPKHWLEDVILCSEFDYVKLGKMIEPAVLEPLGDKSIEVVDAQRLSDNIADCLLKNADAPRYSDGLTPARPNCVLTERTILLTRTTPIRVAIFDPTPDRPAIAINIVNILAFKIRENALKHVTEDYILYSLLNEELRSQLENKYGTRLNTAVFHGSDLMHCKIPLPPINEQEKIVSKAMMNTLTESQRENIKKLEDMVRRNTTLRHHLGSVFALLAGKIDLLEIAINEHDGILNKTDVMLDDYPVTVAEHIEDMKKTKKEIGEIIATMRDYRDDFPIEDINLNAFMSDFVKHYAHIKIDWEPNHEDDSVGVRHSSHALKIVCTNIITNAVRHGFGDKVNPLHDKIRICWYVRDGMVFLDIANNGAPLTIDPDRVLKLCETTDLEKGDGIGGYDIFNYMRGFGGDVQVVSTPDDEFTVTYRLQFDNLINL